MEQEDTVYNNGSIQTQNKYTTIIIIIIIIIIQISNAGGENQL